MHLLHYSEACTAPRMPEFILYVFHSAYQKLEWKDLHPDQRLMEAFFKVGSLVLLLFCGPLFMSHSGARGGKQLLWTPAVVLTGD